MLFYRLSMPHDDDVKCKRFESSSNTTQNIMSRMLDHNTHPWSWSKCSKYYVTDFLEYTIALCFILYYCKNIYYDICLFSDVGMATVCVINRSLIWRKTQQNRPHSLVNSSLQMNNANWYSDDRPVYVHSCRHVDDFGVATISSVVKHNICHGPMGRFAPIICGANVANVCQSIGKHYQKLTVVGVRGAGNISPFLFLIHNEFWSN